MIRIEKFTFNPFQENTYILHDDSGKAVIIDPGCYDRREEERLKSFIQDNSLEPERLINTHGHIDHVLGNAFVNSEYGLHPEIHQEDLSILNNISQYGEAFGIKATPSPEPKSFISENEDISFGESNMSVIHVPGHSPGHIVLVLKDEKAIIGGDVLFYGSIGRTDLPMGDHDTLIKSIHEKLMTLDPEITVHPGHGPKTTIGFEKENNPFLQ